MEDFANNIQKQPNLTIAIVADRTVAQMDNAENRAAGFQKDGRRVEQ